MSATTTRLPTATLQLSGAPRAVVAGQPLELGATDALLLAWLALEGPTPRERLAALLWPHSAAEAARNALRQRLFRLRKQLGCELVAGTALLALADSVQHDLGDAGALLGNLVAPECPELEQWLTTRRAAQRAQGRQGLEQRIEALEAAGDAAAALPLALSLLEADPLSEDAHRRVMRLHYLRGDRAAAMLAFDRCEQVLKHEIGTTPSAATLALLQSVEAGVEQAAPAAAPGWHGALPAAVLRPPRMVGREAELAALHDGWRAGSVLTVTGEAGIGKSRLLQALAASGQHLACASARPGDSLVPYASAARLLRAVLALAPQALASLGPATQERLAPLLPGLASEPAASSAPQRGDLFKPVQALLQAAAGELQGLVLDDLHFADDASLDLLQGLLTSGAAGAPRSAQPLRWCLGLRPPTPDSRLSALVVALAIAVPLVRVPVQPLAVAQLAELVDSLALPGVHGAAVAAALRQRTGGNPLFALETLKLAWSHGRFDLGGDLPRPQSLAQLIGQQLARLSAPALMLARVAAIAGADFSLALAEQVLKQSALQLADPWHELEGQQVMAGTDFAHDMVFEAVLASVPALIARHLHGQVAALLEASGGEPARVAAHWEAAGQRARALPGLRAAAERAHHAMRERERIDFLLRAADIAEATGERALAFDCVARAVETHMNSIRQADGFPLLNRLDRLVQEPAERVRALGHRAWYCSQLPDHAEAVRIGEQALALAEALGERALIVPIRQRLATALAMLARFDEALAHLRAVQAWADDHLEPDDLAEFYGNFAVVLDNLGRPDEARTHHRRALAHSQDQAQAQANHAQRATHLANHAVNRLNAGDVAGAMQLVEQGQQLAASFELEGASVAFLWLLRSQGARALGRYADALAAAEQALTQLQTSTPARQPIVWLHRAHCWLDLGQYARAGQDLLAAADGAALPAYMQARRLLLQARLQRALGQDPGGLLAQALALAPANGWPEVRMTIEVEQAIAAPAAQALAALARVCQAAEPLGLRGSVLAALLRTAVAAAPLDGARAAAAARAALAWSRSDVLPTLRPRAEIWLCAARGLAAGGHTDEAAACVRQGRQWLHETAAQQVDEAFRESFLQRCAAHAELLALGA